MLKFGNADSTVFVTSPRVSRSGYSRRWTFDCQSTIVIAAAFYSVPFSWDEYEGDQGENHGDVPAVRLSLFKTISCTNPGGTLDDPHIDGLKRRHGSSVRFWRYRSRAYTQSGQEVICSSCHRWCWKWSGAKMVGDACMRGHWTILLKSQHASKKIHKAMHAHACGHDHETSDAASLA